MSKVFCLFIFLINFRIQRQSKKKTEGRKEGRKLDKDKSIPEFSVICRVIEFGLFLGHHLVPLAGAEKNDIKRCFLLVCTLTYGMEDSVANMKHTYHSKLQSIPHFPMDFSAAPAELECRSHSPKR